MSGESYRRYHQPQLRCVSATGHRIYGSQSQSNEITHHSTYLAHSARISAARRCSIASKFSARSDNFRTRRGSVASRRTNGRPEIYTYEAMSNVSRHLKLSTVPTGSSRVQNQIHLVGFGVFGRALRMDRIARSPCTRGWAAPKTFKLHCRGLLKLGAPWTFNSRSSALPR